MTTYTTDHLWRDWQYPVDWTFDYGTTTTSNSWTLAGLAVPKARNRWRLTALVAVAHAAFFLALAVAGWLS